jgi:DNA ligase-1
VQVHRAGDEIRVLTRRLDDITSRVQEVVEAIRDLLLTAFFFDLLHLDGEDWIDRPGAERRAALEAIAPASLLILRVVTADPAEAKRFLAGTLTCGHEGGGVADRALRGRPPQGPAEQPPRYPGGLALRFAASCASGRTSAPTRPAHRHRPHDPRRRSDVTRLRWPTAAVTHG